MRIIGLASYYMTQMQTAVTAYLNSTHLLLFAYVQRNLLIV